MRLDAGITVDLDDRFRKTIAGLPQKVRLEGNTMHTAIATQLLARHAPHVTISDDGEPVTLCSLEAYGAAQLAAFLEGKKFHGRHLLHTLPETLLVAYAERHGIPVVHEAHDALRQALDHVAAGQPQTYFSLARSMERVGTLPKKGT